MVAPGDRLERLKWDEMVVADTADARVAPCSWLLWLRAPAVRESSSSAWVGQEQTSKEENVGRLVQRCSRQDTQGRLHCKQR